MVQRLLARLGAGRFGPVRLALVFGLASVPVVTLAVASPTHSADYVAKPVSLGDALTIAIAAVVAASLVGGLVGGRLTRRPTLAILAALAMAWFVGVASLSVTPWLLGIRYEGTTVCIGICNSFVSSANPVSGATTWAIGLGMSLSMVVPLVIALLLLVAARRATRLGDPSAAAVMLVIGHAVAQFMTFVGGGAPAVFVYVCLAVGVIAWTGIVMPGSAPSAAPVAAAEG